MIFNIRIKPPLIPSQYYRNKFLQRICLTINVEDDVETILQLKTIILHRLLANRCQIFYITHIRTALGNINAFMRFE